MAIWTGVNNRNSASSGKEWGALEGFFYNHLVRLCCDLSGRIEVLCVTTQNNYFLSMKRIYLTFDTSLGRIKKSEARCGFNPTLFKLFLQMLRQRIQWWARPCNRNTAVKLQACAKGSLLDGRAPISRANFRGNKNKRNTVALKYVENIETFTELFKRKIKHAKGLPEASRTQSLFS